MISRKLFSNFQFTSNCFHVNVFPFQSVWKLDKNWNRKSSSLYWYKRIKLYVKNIITVPGSAILFFEKTTFLVTSKVVLTFLCSQLFYRYAPESPENTPQPPASPEFPRNPQTFNLNYEVLKFQPFLKQNYSEISKDCTKRGNLFQVKHDRHLGNACNLCIF